MSSKNCLQELLQKNSCNLPEYVREDTSGPSHDPWYKYSVTAMWKDGNSYSEYGSGRSKKDAQQEAAKKLFDKLATLENGASRGASPYSTPPRVSVDRFGDDDLPKRFSSPSQVKNKLQEVLQRNRLPIPRYVLEKQSGPSHDPKFTVKLEILSTKREVIWDAIGSGRTKLSAEFDAAEKGLKYVQEIVTKHGGLFTLMSKKPKAPIRDFVDPSLDRDLNSQLPKDTETVFIQSDEDESGRTTWLCMKMVKHKQLNTTVASHGEGQSKEDAERQASCNLIHSIEALQRGVKTAVDSIDYNCSF